MSSQRILFDGFESDSLYLCVGAPEGSCLGLLLSTVYASKLLEIIQAHLLDAHCFADDTQLYLSFKPNILKDQAEAVCAMERCISELRKWMYQDKLMMIRLNFLLSDLDRNCWKLILVLSCTVLLAQQTLRLLQTFEGLLFAECLFFDQIKVNYLNLHFQKQII